MARVNKGSHSFTCHPHVYPQVEWTIPAFTPQLQSIITLWLVLISCPDEGRRLSWPGKYIVTAHVDNLYSTESAKLKHRLFVLIRNKNIQTIQCSHLNDSCMDSGHNSVCECIWHSTILITQYNFDHHHHNRFTALFRDHPDKPLPEENWTLWCKGRLF